MTTDLTIIIVAFKSEEKIEDCLNSIDPNIKIIIVDNSNSLILKKKIEHKFKNVEYILSEVNLGYGKANNLALKKVRTRYSLILNPDTILDKNAVKIFFNFIEKNIDFAILGPNQSEKIENVKDNDLNNLSLHEVDDIKGYCMFLNMKKFSEIGFFDENFFLYLEEIDLCKRAKKNKQKIYVHPMIKVFHHGGKSVDSIYLNQVEIFRNWHWMWSLFYFNKKHFNFFYALFTVLPKIFNSILKIIYYSFIYNFIKRKIYISRLSGLYNSILNKPSWFRITLD